MLTYVSAGPGGEEKNKACLEWPWSIKIDMSIWSVPVFAQGSRHVLRPYLVGQKRSTCVWGGPGKSRSPHRFRIALAGGKRSKSVWSCPGQSNRISTQMCAQVYFDRTGASKRDEGAKTSQTVLEILACRGSVVHWTSIRNRI